MKLPPLPWLAASKGLPEVGRSLFFFCQKTDVFIMSPGAKGLPQPPQICASRKMQTSRPPRGLIVAISFHHKISDGPSPHRNGSPSSIQEPRKSLEKSTPTSFNIGTSQTPKPKRLSSTQGSPTLPVSIFLWRKMTESTLHADCSRFSF